MKCQIASAMTLALCLLACAQETVPRDGVRNAVALPNQVAPTRVILQFKNPSAVDAQAFVQRLQTLSPAPVRYVAAVSVDTHVYLMPPQPTQSTGQLLQQLSAMPEIARAELDPKAKSR